MKRYTALVIYRCATGTQYLHPFPGPPVRVVGVVDESAVSLADFTHSRLVIDGMFVDEIQEKSMKVVPVVLPAKYVVTVASLGS